MLCDLCTTTMPHDGHRYPASVIRDAARAGLRPSDPLTTNGQAPDAPPKAAAVGWLQMVMSETADWTVCTPCASEVTTALSTAQPASGFAGYSGFWKRWAAWLIDGLAVVAGWTSIIVVEFLLVYIVGIVRSGPDMTVAGSPTQREYYPVVYALWLLTALIFPWLYYALMESSSLQATCGKMAVGIGVTDAEGNRIGFRRATARYFGKLISGLPLLLGYAMAGFTPKKQALHDIMAGCLVLNKRTPA
jgi:uncharacterized RDD family membrane protein YckC